MSNPKTIERRAFLASSAATMVVGVAGCESTSEGPVDTATTGASTTTSTSTAPTTTTTTATTASSTSSSATSSSSTSSTTTSQSTASNGTSSDASNSSSLSSSPDSTSEASSSPISSEPVTPADDACFEGGGTDGGVSDDAGAGVLCSTNTDNGDHCHPLLVPQSDATAGFAEATYTLEDGGTGHTHTVTVTAYDFYYLQAGIPHSLVSTEQAGHYHVCQISCPPPT